MTRLRQHGATWVCLGALALMAVYYFLSAPTDGNFWWFDASRHAMNGVFLSDMLSQGGMLHPIAFAKAYYEKYPAINIGFYPPFFYISSVPLLLLFGVSHAVTQSVVALYTLAAGVLVFSICRAAMDRISALATALCILALAPMALWARQVQLDVPAIAMYLLTAWALIRFLETGKQNWMFAAGILLGLAMLTRVQGVFLVPVFLLFVFFHRLPVRPSLAKRVAASVIAGLVALPAVVMVQYFSSVNQALATKMPGMPALWTFENWTWYAQQLPEQVGWPATCLMAVGLIAAAVVAAQGRATTGLKVVAACWACAWIFFSVVSNKEPRFNLPGIVFLCLLAAYGLYVFSAITARIALPVLCAWLLFQIGIAPPVPVVNGFQEAVTTVQALAPANSNVMISAHRDGNFIFDLRSQGTRRDIGVRRADKLIVEIRIMRQLGVHDQGLDQTAILALMDQHNVSLVVMQPGYLADLSSMKNFQGLLDDGVHYEKVRTLALTGETPPSERELVIYRRKSAP